MSMHLCSDQRFPANSKIYSGSRHPKPPILESTYYLPIKPLKHGEDQVYSPGPDGGRTPLLPWECRGEVPSPTIQLSKERITHWAIN
jgi:hypothetical protein